MDFKHLYMTTENKEENIGLQKKCDIEIYIEIDRKIMGFDTKC